MASSFKEEISQKKKTEKKQEQNDSVHITTFKIDFIYRYVHGDLAGQPG